MLRRTIKPGRQELRTILYSGESGMAGLFISSILHIDKETTLPKTLTGVERRLRMVVWSRGRGYGRDDHERRVAIGSGHAILFP